MELGLRWARIVTFPLSSSCSRAEARMRTTLCSFPRGENSPDHSTQLPRVNEQGSDCACSHQGQAPRGSGASKIGSFTSPQYNNQISQDQELGTDLWSVTSTYMCGPRRLPGDRWDLTGPGTMQGHSKPHFLSTLLTPEPGEGRDQQTGCATQWVGSDLWRRVLSAFLPGPIHSRKQRDRSNSLE